jgi:pyruvate kinase
MRRNRNVKVVATLGPASSDREMIKALFEAGADVFRLNMSHGDHEDHAHRHRIIREIEHELQRPIGILADLQGPKLRVGVFAKGPVMLLSGATFRLDLDETPGDAIRVQLPHPEIFAALEPDSTLLIDDGKIRLKVTACDADSAECEVIVGGKISDRKGVNVPDVVLPLTALSTKDKADLEFACELGVDWLALSFVQRRQDVEDARVLTKGRAAILSKIEKPAALKDLDAIIDASDAIMVARGDLGVEMPIAEVPPLQKKIVHACRRVGKPVIVATQMMESMITSPVPTRAEVSDAAQAIYEGADAIMLSAESAAGQYPVEAVLMMDNVARTVEGNEPYREIINRAYQAAPPGVATSITVAAREVAETTDVKAICCFTHSGTTALLAARERPSVPIIALTPQRATARRLALAWGLHCMICEEVERFKLAVVSAARAATTAGFATRADNIVVTAGVPFNVAGTTNILRVAPCDESAIYSGEPE